MGPRRVPDLEELYRRDRARRFVAAAGRPAAPVGRLLGRRGTRSAPIGMPVTCTP
jgi:hypothetical protein